ncbi:MAG: UvrD-helicase domain-containing protein [Burkholderiaceae bacterium]|nr:UvrD-helicase domain-containing protein [Burkholderiaceae bacterium]
MTQAAYELNGTLISSAQFYAIACDPRRSVAIEACAGAGKTWMLVSRMLRALLEDDATQAHEILAITFTKKAAGEMRLRLQEWLAEFASAPLEKLESELVMRGMSPESAKNKREVLQNLYQTLLGKGRGVQIRTFHGWFAALLRTAPLSVLEDLNLPANYQLLEDDKLAVPGVWRRFFATLLAEPAAMQDFESLVQAYGRSQALKALEEALSKRVEFVLADQQGVVETSMPHFSAFYPEFAGLASLDEVLEHSEIHRRIFLDAAQVLGAAKAPTFSAKGLELEQAVTDKRLDAALAALLTDKGAPRKFNAVLAANDLVNKAQELALRLQSAQVQHAAWQHQQCMTRLTRLLNAEFAALKRERGWIDMNDVERAAQHMLSDVDLSGWVQERLDARVKHLMIDEFQDTSPLQWQALYAWLSGYAGAGSSTGSASSSAPSVFIVGDPKQSIYRFRRAEPQVFLAAQAFVVDGLAGDLLSCDHTRRNATQVIASVNAVMQSAQSAGEYQDFRDHSTAAKDAGTVQRLPQIGRDAVAKLTHQAATDGAVPAWRDSLTTPRVIFEEKLITLECRQAAQFIAQQLADGAKAEEIMVLARKRARLSVMQEELQTLGIASQQPDKSELADAPEVQDVVALLDALVSTTHDLSLARALKSPLFGVDDAALVELALLQRADLINGTGSQRTSWYELLQNSEQLPDCLCRLGPVLSRWKSWLDDLPPHDALDAIFHDGDVLARFASASPPTLRVRVLVNLRALLSAALDINAARYATPYAFVRVMKSGRSETSRAGDASMVDATQIVKAPTQNDANAVKLLTIHGAKGLEAGLVLLLDTHSPPTKAATMSVLVDWPGESEAPTSFVFLASESRPAPSVVAALDVEMAARKREELNALYVAMTRAKQQLVISSVEPYRDPGVTWWQRLQDLTEPCHAVLTQPGEIETMHTQGTVRLEPACGFRQAQPEQGLKLHKIELVVLPELKNSSNLPQAGVNYASLATNLIANVGLAGTSKGSSNLSSGIALADSLESRIGQAMHRLLQCLPAQTQATTANDHRFEAASVKAVAQAFALSPAQADQAVAMAQRILTGEGAWSWSQAVIDWQGNEVELFSRGQLLRLDRLVRCVDTGHWWVLDYKSESQPQRKPELMAQLQAYRAAVQASQKDGVVKAAFLTGSGQMVEVFGDN